MSAERPVESDVDGAVLVASVHFHAGTSTQRIWHVQPEVAERLMAELGEPHATTLMDAAHMDAVDEAMTGTPIVYGSGV